MIFLNTYRTIGNKKTKPTCHTNFFVSFQGFYRHQLFLHALILTKYWHEQRIEVHKNAISGTKRSKWNYWHISKAIFLLETFMNVWKSCFLKRNNQSILEINTMYLWKHKWFGLSHCTWQIQLWCPWSKWNMGEL